MCIDYEPTLEGGFMTDDEAMQGGALEQRVQRVMDLANGVAGRLNDELLREPPRNNEPVAAWLTCRDRIAYLLLGSRLPPATARQELICGPL